MRRLLVFLVLILSVLGFGLSSQAKQDKIKAAFLYVGPHNDGGWSQAHDEGRMYLQKHLPYVITSYSESVPEGAACEKIIRDYIHKGYKVIFGTSFGFMDSMYNVAKDYPDVIFEHCSGYKTRKNMGTYFGRMYQVDYLAGLVAGMMTKTNYIGFVAPFPIPEVVREIDSFTIGVREVNPKAEVHVIWTNSWFNPVKERSAAETFIANKADIIVSGCDSPASIEAAKAAGIHAIAYDRDIHDKFPKTILTSRAWNWGVFYVKVLKEIKNGTWKSNQYWGGLETGIVKLGKFGDDVPEKVKKYVLKRAEQIKEGKFKVFSGPIYNQQGKLMVKEGQELPDKDKLSLQWFVKGVIGSIPH
ncbi:BMP family ABC transporter substrate-binding protein [Hippea maritima]|uniref:Basic membrane lipoprotein n=1 Tax=Hippea maritima (strain ATCC 700847 / DSM 10411 / MH2) TaxID=760142 RepID=F2LX15_HIPMA|nr:BMP family ABC transporter substrate-binding protein [Hippea maritima]AEA34199.1 basic membrane lipoprotein [Hippea maritima DSM 10411]